MSTELECECGRKVSAEGYLPGALVRCPRCGKSVRVPQPPKKPAETAEYVPPPKPPRKFRLASRPQWDAPITEAPPAAPGGAGPTVPMPPAPAPLESVLAAAGFSPGVAPPMLGMPPAWVEPPRRRMSPLAVRRALVAGGGIALLVMLVLVGVAVVPEWLSRPPDWVATGDRDDATRSNAAEGSPSASTGSATGGSTHPPATTSGNGSSISGNGTADDDTSAPAAGNTPPDASGTSASPPDLATMAAARQRLAGIWETVQEADLAWFDLRADGSSVSFWRRDDGGTSLEPGRWEIGAVTEQGYVLRLVPTARPDRATTVSVSFVEDALHVTRNDPGQSVTYRRRPTPAATDVATTVASTDTPPSADDPFEEPAPTMRTTSQRLLGLWDFARPGARKNASLAFEEDGSLYILETAPGGARHTSATWKVTSEEQDELRLFVTLVRAKPPGSPGTPMIAPPKTRPPRTGGAEVVVRLEGEDRLRIDFLSFDLEAGGEYYRRDTPTPERTERLTGDEDEPATGRSRWEVVSVLPGAYTRVKKSGGPRPPAGAPAFVETVSHPGSDYLHVTLEFTRGDFAPTDVNLRLVNAEGWPVGMLSWTDRVEGEPKRLLAIFQRLGDFAPTSELLVVDGQTRLPLE